MGSHRHLPVESSRGLHSVCSMLSATQETCRLGMLCRACRVWAFRPETPALTLDSVAMTHALQVFLSGSVQQELGYHLIVLPRANVCSPPHMTVTGRLPVSRMPPLALPSLAHSCAQDPPPLKRGHQLFTSRARMRFLMGLPSEGPGGEPGEGTAPVQAQWMICSLATSAVTS